MHVYVHLTRSEGRSLWGQGDLIGRLEQLDLGGSVDPDPRHIGFDMCVTVRVLRDQDGTDVRRI